MTINDVLGQPALFFEQANGLTGIAGRYAFPNKAGLDRLSLQKTLWPAGMAEIPHDKMSTIFHELRELNPDAISKINFKPEIPHQVNDVVRGMVSGFNVDDINLFMKRAHGNLSPTVNKGLFNEIRAWEIKIMQRLDHPHAMQWVASEPTLQNIWNQVKDRPIQRSLDISTGIVNASANKWLIGGVIAAAAIGGYVIGRWMTSKKDEGGFAAAHLNEKSNKTEQPTLPR